MIQFQHSLFALPFALTAMLVAAEGWPTARTAALVVACLVSARTAAMTFNRLVDRRFDAANPRTRDRALPAGRVPPAAAWAMLVVSAATFVAAAVLLNRLTAILSPVALAIVLAYSLAKRVTAATHFLLGLGLAVAPIGAWIAVRGTLDPAVLILGAAVAAWTAGFDLLYACQDVDFDRAAGLHSIPARLGERPAMRLAAACHVAALAGFASFALACGLVPGMLAATAVAALILSAAHVAVRRDRAWLGVAFFQANVAVGFAILAGAAWDVLAAP